MGFLKFGEFLRSHISYMQRLDWFIIQLIETTIFYMVVFEGFKVVPLN